MDESDEPWYEHLEDAAVDMSHAAVSGAEMVYHSAAAGVDAVVGDHAGANEHMDAADQSEHDMTGYVEDAGEEVGEMWDPPGYPFPKPPPVPDKPPDIPPDPSWPPVPVPDEPEPDLDAEEYSAE